MQKRNAATEAQRHRGGPLLPRRHSGRQQQNEMLFILLPESLPFALRRGRSSWPLCLCASVAVFLFPRIQSALQIEERPSPRPSPGVPGEGEVRDGGRELS